MLNTFNASYEVLSWTYFSRMTIPTPSLSSHRASEAEVQQNAVSWLLLVKYWYETVHELNTPCTLLLRRSVRWRKGACRLALCLITEYTGRNSRRSDGGNTGGMGCEGHKSSVPVHGHKHKGHQSAAEQSTLIGPDCPLVTTRLEHYKVVGLFPTVRT